MSREKTAGLDGQVTNDPALVVEEKIHDLSQVAVAGARLVTFEVFQTSQHGVPAIFLRPILAPCQPCFIAVPVGRSWRDRNFNVPLRSSWRKSAFYLDWALPDA